MKRPIPLRFESTAHIEHCPLASKPHAVDEATLAMKLHGLGGNNGNSTWANS